jgi:hypothetical protein
MLLSHSGEARLKMAGSMYTTARELVVASIRAADPSASAAAVRQRLFLRFYGHEFDVPTRERILVRLGAVEATGGAPPRRGRRRVPIDWDFLEVALTSRVGEATSLLDLRTGEVHLCRLGSEPDDYELSEEEADAGLAEGYLVRVDPLDSSREWGWMADFTASIGDPRIRDDLDAAFRGRRPFRRFKDVLAAHPREREQWGRFRDARVREALLEWLADHEIEPTTPPPARRER